MGFLNIIVCQSSFLLSSDKCVILVSIPTSPESVLYGIGGTKEEALKIAATNALEYLKLMTT
jgi:dsRNA-specific ribonuclease